MVADSVVAFVALCCMVGYVCSLTLRHRRPLPGIEPGHVSIAGFFLVTLAIIMLTVFRWMQ
jgi:hypothetical protein